MGICQGRWKTAPGSCRSQLCAAGPAESSAAGVTLPLEQERERPCWEAKGCSWLCGHRAAGTSWEIQQLCLLCSAWRMLQAWFSSKITSTGSLGNIRDTDCISHKTKQTAEEPQTTSHSSLGAVVQGLVKGEDGPKHRAVGCSSVECFSSVWDIPHYLLNKI